MYIYIIYIYIYIYICIYIYVCIYIAWRKAWRNGRLCLSDLAEDKSMVIKSVDKGSCVVI